MLLSEMEACLAIMESCDFLLENASLLQRFFLGHDIFIHPLPVAPYKGTQHNDPNFLELFTKALGYRMVSMQDFIIVK